jgi:HK97 family phage major capsid protein
MYAKQLREKLAAVSAQMNALIDAAKKENNRGLTKDEQQTFDRMVDDYSSIEASIARAEKAEQISNDLRSVPKDQILDQFNIDNKAAAEKANRELHTSAFNNYLRGGLEGCSTEERQLLASKHVANSGPNGIRNAQSNTNTAGGYLIPTGFSDQLEVALKFFGGILGVVGSFDTETGNPIPWPTVNDTAQSGRIIGQNVQVTETDLTFGNVNFGSYIFSSDSVLVPLSLLQDSYFDLNGFIANALGTRLGRLMNTKFTVGSGSSEPTGLVTAANTAGLTYTVTTGETTSVIYDDLVELEHKVDRAYRAGGKFMFADSTLKVLKKIKDSAGRPLWQPGLTAGLANGAPPTILDHPYEINNDMASMAANAKSILFGAFEKFKVRRVAGGTTILRLTERYADYLQVAYIGFLRADSNLVDAGTHPVAVLINSAT